MSTGRVLQIAIVLAALAAPLDAIAQPRDPAAAEALFRAGREASERGDWAKARDSFRESHRLDPAAGTLLNLALCEESLGELASAWQHFQQIVAELPDGDDRMAFARKHLDDLSGRVPRLTLRAAPGSPPDMNVTRDGVPIGRESLGTAAPVNPGVHVVEVSAAGRKPRTYPVVVRESRSELLEVEPGEPIPGPEPAPLAPSAPAPAPASAAPPPSGMRRTAGFIAGGVGLGGIALGAVTGALVFSKKAEVLDNCERDGAGDLACNPTGQQASDVGQTLATTSTIAFVVGAASLGLGVFLVATSRPTRRAGSAAGLALQASARGVSCRF